MKLRWAVESVYLSSIWELILLYPLRDRESNPDLPRNGWKYWRFHYLGRSIWFVQKILDPQAVVKYQRIKESLRDLIIISFLEDFTVLFIFVLEVVLYMFVCLFVACYVVSWGCHWIQQCGGVMRSWSSGYDVCLTRRRSWVQSLATVQRTLNYGPHQSGQYLLTPPLFETSFS